MKLLRSSAQTVVIPRHRVSPSASPMTGSSGVSSTLRLLDSITPVSGILDRPVKSGDDNLECGRVLISSLATKQSTPRMDSGLLRFARNDGILISNSKDNLGR